MVSKRGYRCNGLQSGEVALDARHGRLELRHHDLTTSTVNKKHILPIQRHINYHPNLIWQRRQRGYAKGYVQVP